jgi:uncharacterized protein
MRQRAEPRTGLAARLAIVVTALVLGWVATSLVRQWLLAAGTPVQMVQAIQAVLAGAIGMSVIFLACRHLDRRAVTSLGASLREPDWSALLTSAMLWLSLAALAIVAGIVTGAFTVNFEVPAPSIFGWVLLQSALVLIYEALPEELAFRGYVYTNLVERTRRWVAVLGQSVLFTVWAFALVTALQLVGLGADWSIGLDRTVLFLTFGITLSLLRIWTGSLWAAIGFHWAFQTVTQLIYLGRLQWLQVPPGADLEMLGIFLWFFTVVLGGVIVLVAVARRERRVALS